MLKRFGARFAVVAAVTLVPGLSGQPAAQCGGLTRFEIPGVPLVITKAEWIPAAEPGKAANLPNVAVALPAYCRVDGMINARTGADGKAYGIGFALALPDNWNNRFLFQGGGGLNGTVQPPLGAAASGGNPALARGFAVVSTDSGHKGAVFDASFNRDQQASLDFAYQAVGRVTSVAKQLVARYYMRPAAHSYFAGCSTGGREAMLTTQRYPTEFDGVISGDPAMRTGFSGIGDRWVAVTFNQIAPKDAAGKPAASGAFSESDKKLIVGSILQACDERDGLKDGMIFNPQACHFDPAALICPGAKTDACLSAGQAGALKKAFAGPKDSKGNAVYPGFPFDTGITATGGIPGLLTRGPSPLGPPNQATEQDVDKEAANAAADPRQALADTTFTNLSTFSGHGGKLLFYHGLSDPWFSPLDTLGYYERLSKDNGGMEKAAGWSRLFLVPGMGHCGGGPATLDNFDLLTALVNWVENGTAPDSVAATGKAFAGRSRPLCAYPKHAQYKGQGDPEDAKNFECRE